MERTKVIGIGFHKTGTTTLGTCMEMLGYNHISYNREAFLLYYDNEIDAMIKLMSHFDSFEDWPWPFIYKEAYKAFPDAKFVLTTRKDEETWFRSLSKHVQRGDGDGFKFREYIYGYENPDDNKPLHINKYLEHNANVREFFKDKPGSLLEVCWENGDGWPELGAFLDLDIDGLEFPHSNQGSKRNGLSQRVKKATKTLIGI
ncbi:sulfotransferase family protein [Vibrio hippocampi]|uniref:Sulfotransferase family protein n=1 Tax=Vibrio hippocampi TaxID=654686 RepID=A0ABN8DIX7_9VIBR|nr:sulfotransferase family protein [Vibrio hippocampi]CAH0529145.1 hypothetical protein VHP8226_03073 [Vibrio hippocampi]